MRNPWPHQKSDVSVQTEIPTPYVLSSGENTTGFFGYPHTE